MDKARAQLLEEIINICAGRLISEEILSHPQYKTLSTITNRICHQLRVFQKVTTSKDVRYSPNFIKVHIKHTEPQPQMSAGHRIFEQVQNQNNCNGNTGAITTAEIESDMQELVQSVFCNSPDSLDPEFKQIFFMVARTFYYTAYCDPNIINDHIGKVLFGTRM